MRQILDTYAELELAILVESRAEDRARPESDWDIAIQWKREISLVENLASTEGLRHELAVALGVGEDGIELRNL